MTGQARNYEIYTMDDVDSSPADGCGDNPTRLSYTAAPANSGTSDLRGYDLSPVYSPDGTKICFHSGRASLPAQWEIYTLDAVNGEERGTAPNVVGTPSVRRTFREDGNDERCAWQETP